MEFQFGDGNERGLLKANRCLTIVDEEVKNKSIMRSDDIITSRLHQVDIHLLKDSLSAHFFHFDSRTVSESSSRGSASSWFAGAKALARRSICPQSVSLQTFEN